MEDINRKELLAIEAQLDARERFCMYAYMLLKENDSQAYFDAYIYSRPTLPKGNRELLTRKATEWINSEPCRAFVQLYETQADDEIDRRRKMIVNAPETKEELTKEEELVMELEKLKEVTDNFDEKVKAINLIANIRHKNKALQKNDNPVRFFVPQRCNSIDCPLYRAEEKRLKEEGKLKY